MVFAEFRRRFDVLAPHLTKKHGRNFIVTDEKRHLNANGANHRLPLTIAYAYGRNGNITREEGEIEWKEKRRLKGRRE
ncbi:hypothetical protein NHX12_010689 [Muraenolepis orangiensis]|uniref:Uncharacterized protein n=1 Tax=Muraenolepis orangiensis TaxID=630683 RepID=A0A9Q0DLV3_9TELE|nr:hypothetical protein NHX12_010689 [Muraenolepis orangiensis]